MALRLIKKLTYSLFIFSSGLITGWWLHLRWPPPEVIRSDTQIIPYVTIAPAHPPKPEHSPVILEKVDELADFLQALNESRYDDALTIYQQFESTGSPIALELRNIFLETIQGWHLSQQHNLVILALERFTDYYYQDIDLLKKLASAYEQDQQLDKSIETYLSARSYADQQDQLAFMDKQTHRIAQQMYKKHQRHQNLELLLPLFQKLAYLKPDYAFYRWVLAEGYIAALDNNSAINELEMLQFDPDYGNKASQRLAELLPPPPAPDEPDDSPQIIPLSGSGGHYIVNAVAGNKYGVRLLIDTGASYTTLPNHILQPLRKRELATRIAHVELKTANGIRMAPIYRLKQFQIGPYSLMNIEVAELELGSGGSDGLLGMNVLKEFHFFIDQNRKSLSLSPR